MNDLKKSIIVSKACKKDLKRLIKQGTNFANFDVVIRYLEKDKGIPSKYRKHKLKGKLSGYNECHISPDWVLVWKEDKESVHLVRTGSHSDIFK